MFWSSVSRDGKFCASLPHDLCVDRAEFSTDHAHTPIKMQLSNKRARNPEAQRHPHRSWSTRFTETSGTSGYNKDAYSIVPLYKRESNQHWFSLILQMRQDRVREEHNGALGLLSPMAFYQGPANPTPSYLKQWLSAFVRC